VIQTFFPAIALAKAKSSPLYSSCRLNAIQLRAQTLRPYRIGDETLYLITAGSAVIIL
jgi:hypothetical protein